MPGRGLRRSMTIGVTAFALGIGIVQPAESTRPTAHPSMTTAATGTVARLTLVTGHRVQVSRDTAGRQAASVEAPSGRRADTFSFTDKAGDLHVVPRQVLPYLQSGRLDGRLFNVTDLIEQGYAKRPDIPLIVSYPRTYSAATVDTQARSLRTAGATRTRSFGSADAVAVTVPAKGAASFWNAVDGPGAKAGTAPALLGGAAKIWLDGKVRATLEQSVPLVGAPRAWAAGYDGSTVTVAVLDTGYDAAHPDLAGRVVGSQSFGATGSVADRNGHGTHVAATVAGSGAASQGSRKGVAPGAKLMIGKVLDDGGNGEESWVLAGMEWAARGGAKVVSMSLGGGPTDGNDPLSQAVDSLTAETGALFVIAAGNSGPGSGTVSSPGAATSALTVGNTDKSDQLNESSSRGPRLGDHAVKPELTAPGTDIVAARAAGTSLGSPVDENYTSLTGTSMATPHVAGAAAILAQRHPGWTPEQIKSALVGSAAAPAAGTVFEHGSGRLDVSAALGATVVADNSTLSFGYLPWPGSSTGKISRTATYRNTGTEPVTLDLALSAQYVVGRAADVATVSPARLVVPAGGSAQATVTLDPALVDPGTDVSGLLVATGGGTPVRTPWSYGEESAHYDLTITTTGKDGAPSTGWAQVWGKKMGAYYYGVQIGAEGKHTVRLPADEYMIIGAATRYDPTGTIIEEEAVGGNPHLTLAANATVALDARKANPLGFVTPRASTPSQLQLSWVRSFGDDLYMDGFLSYGGQGSSLPKLSVIPSAAVRSGEFEFTAGGRLVAPKSEPGRTPYLYDLALPTADRLPASATYRVRPRDLASIDSTFAGVGTQGRTTKENRLGFTPRGRLQVNGAGEVLVAGPRTDYVSANGTEWQSWVALPHTGDDEVPTMWDITRAYPAGAKLSTKWWGAPYTVGTDSDYSVTDAYRQDDRLSFLIRDYQDGDPFHWGDSYWNEHPTQTVKSRFYQGDKLLREENRGWMDIEGLPDEDTTYRYVHTITRRGAVWSSSSYSETDWTFRSARESNGQWPPKGIPLLDLNWTVPTDQNNQARARAPFAIGLHARHVRGLTNGKLQPAKLWVSYDDGKKWHQVPLVRRPGDKYVGILLHPPKSLTTGWVSLRGEVRDSAGGALKQTTLRAYALR